MEMLFAMIVLAHSWYPHECCNDLDCRRVPCTEIERLGDNFVWLEWWTQQKHFFPQNRLRPSQDDGCHVCVTSKQTFPSGICLFMPDRTS